MTRCIHAKFGLGRIRFIEGSTTFVVFDDGSQVAFDDGLWQGHSMYSFVQLPPITGPEAPVASALTAVVRAQAVAIRSVQDRWGIFSPARVRLLPHQLWVCQRVLSQWPGRWLVADDVGLGETIEAGLIVSSVLTNSAVKRVLVLCPASLVDQWQERLREMFDIRTLAFSSETERSTTFWEDNSQVVASLHRLRIDHCNDDEITQWERLFDAPAWDLVIVDGAHHLHSDVNTGDTLGLGLLRNMLARGLIRSLLLFTGTPHHGKHYGFQGLLGLLDPDITPETPWDEVRPKLAKLVIRNNKQDCTDLAGNRLFLPVTVSTRAFTFSADERAFYEALTRFVLTGLLYDARGLSARRGSRRMLLLFALLKIATSSTAAMMSAIRRRIPTLIAAKSEAEAQAQAQLRPENRAALDAFINNLDGFTYVIKQRAENGVGLDADAWDNPEGEVDLVADSAFSVLGDFDAEIAHLEQLLVLGSQVTQETRIEEIIRIVQALPGTETVLFFTEYKETQARLVFRLGAVFGPACVTFINGDGRLVNVSFGAGAEGALTQDRGTAAYGFNQGTYRFLVSTEAAAEGIDLHMNCARLIHVDVPWNPIRMHQRVGRLNRIGQQRPVSVTIMRNDEALEEIILGRLYERLDAVQAAFDGSMADPDDMRGLVLGAVGSNTRLLSEALRRSAECGEDRESFTTWYAGALDAVAGQDVVELVQGLLGDVARFDFEKHGRGVPDIDLGDLRAFTKAAVRAGGKAVVQAEDGSLVFQIPEGWKNQEFAHFTVQFERKQTVFFARDGVPETSPQNRSRLSETSPQDRSRLMGAGDRLFDAALAWAERLPAQVAGVRGLPAPLVLFTCVRPTSVAGAAVQRVLVGAELGEGGVWSGLQDWEVLKRLNAFVAHPDADAVRLPAEGVRSLDEGAIAAAMAVVKANAEVLGVPFSEPVVMPFAVFVPVSG